MSDGLPESRLADSGRVTSRGAHVPTVLHRASCWDRVGGSLRWFRVMEDGSGLDHRRQSDMADQVVAEGQAMTQPFPCTRLDQDFDRIFGDSWQPTIPDKPVPLPIPPMPIPEFPPHEGS